MGDRTSKEIQEEIDRLNISKGWYEMGLEQYSRPRQNREANAIEKYKESWDFGGDTDEQYSRLFDLEDKKKETDQSISKYEQTIRGLESRIKELEQELKEALNREKKEAEAEKIPTEVAEIMKEEQTEEMPTEVAEKMEEEPSKKIPEEGAEIFPFNASYHKRSPHNTSKGKNATVIDGTGQFKVLHYSEDTQNTSVEPEYLTNGDAESLKEEYLARKLAPDIFKLEHHGSAPQIDRIDNEDNVIQPVLKRRKNNPYYSRISGTAN